MARNCSPPAAEAAHLQVLAADLTWLDGKFLPDVHVHVAEGKIAGVYENASVSAPPPPTGTLRALPGRALLPGFINAHSHAFQRLLRGRGEEYHGPATEKSTFWTWRETMYSVASSLREEELYAAARACYEEMIAAGITTVGEFHYLHHQQPHDFALDKVMVRAAKDAGIRQVLLTAAYMHDGPAGEHLQQHQQRFDTRCVLRNADRERRQWEDLAPFPPLSTLLLHHHSLRYEAYILARSLEEYLANLNDVTSELGEASSIGIVAHSLRAVDLVTLSALHRESLARSVPFHLHLEEQRAEVEACLRVHGKRPMRLLLDAVDTCENITAVHCTHTDPSEMTEFIARGGTVCMCPLTEAALGDGIADVGSFQGQVCLGSDGNSRVDFFEEMRWLEYAQRLKAERRGICNAAGNRDPDVAKRLLAHATTCGAKALGVPAGAIEEGLEADFCIVDIQGHNFRGIGDSVDFNLLSALVFSGSASSVVATCVAGQWSKETDTAAGGCQAAPEPQACAVADEGSGSTPHDDISEINDVVDLAEALINIASLSGYEQPMSSALSSWLEHRGWHVTLQPVDAQADVPNGQVRHNVFARPATAVGTPGPRVLFNSHMDTVPPHMPARRDEHRLYGRGACDTKSLLASQLTALLRLEAAGHGGNIGLLYVVSEETDHSGMKAANSLGLHPEFLVTAEPTCSKLVSFQKGMLKVGLSMCGIVPSAFERLIVDCVLEQAVHYCGKSLIVL